MTVSLVELLAWCERSLNTPAFKDYCPNGLQVEGKPSITRLVTGVTANQALIDHAIAHQADAILVHHGYFWKGEAAPLVGMKGHRIRALMKHDISLIAYHLPLDAHPTLGNNRALADLLEFNIQPNTDPTALLMQGDCMPMNVSDMILHLTRKLGRAPLHLAGGPSTIRRVAWCTGGAQDYLSQAAALGCDAFFSGEVSERTFHEAAELGIHYFSCGHHATERGGVQRLGAALAAQFDIDVEFVDLFNPI